MAALQTALFWGILGSPYCSIGATIRIGRAMLCLPYAGILHKLFLTYNKKITNVVKKSRTWETKNLSADADSRTDTISERLH